MYLQSLIVTTVAAVVNAADPLCEEGFAEHNPLRGGDACCPISCGRCGGKDCSKLPGGKEQCCTSYVHAANVSCDKNDPPCVVNGGPAPTPPPSPSPPSPMNVTVSVGGLIVSETDERYVGWTVDLSEDRQFFKLDFKNTTLRYLASQLPNFVRVGGSGQDYIDYDFEGKGCDGVGAQPGLCLNTTQWDALHSFIVGTGSKMVFGLNDCQRSANDAGRRLTNCDRTSGSWNSAKAETLLRYAVAHDQEIFGVELGNERNGQIKGSDQAKDFVVLEALLDSVYGDSKGRPKLFGPDPHSFKDEPERWPDTIKYIEDFIYSMKAAGINLYGITHHEYIEVVIVGEPHNFNDPAVLNRSGDIAALFNSTISKALPAARKWAGEIGPHNGGTNICNHDLMRWANFADSIWYSDSLAAKALHGYHVYTRQDFVGIDYGLIDCVDHTPLPDYYTAVLFHRLMGPKVLTASGTPTDVQLRTYAHCSRTSSKATLLMIHLSEDKQQYVTLEAMDSAEAYVLTALGGDHLSTGVELNGKLLEFANNRLPEMKGASIDTSQPFEVPPLSVTFIEFSGRAARPCSAEIVV